MEGVETEHLYVIYIIAYILHVFLYHMLCQSKVQNNGQEEPHTEVQYILRMSYRPL